MTREGVGRTDHVVGLEGEVMASRAERMDGSDRSMDMAPTTETLPTGTESDPGGFCQVSMTESEQLKKRVKRCMLCDMGKSGCFGVEVERKSIKRASQVKAIRCDTSGETWMVSGQKRWVTDGFRLKDMKWHGSTVLHISCSDTSASQSLPAIPTSLSSSLPILISPPLPPASTSWLFCSIAAL